MPKEVISQIYDPFFTTKGLGKGTGLGLSTVYGIVKQSGGYINVESILDEGTTFSIYLPRELEQVEEYTVKSEVIELPRGEELILLVEDEAELRILAGMILKKQGYKIIEAENGLEALDLCKELEKPVDLVITDVIMPNLGGPALIKQLKSRWSDFKVLFMSGYTANEIENSGLPNTKIPFLQKPFKPDDLIGKVRNVLDS